MAKLLVLALLGIQPMSGYDIKETLKSMDAERWSGLLIGSIYNALNKLEKEGYIEVSHIEQTGHRQKAIYAITNRGKEYEKQLIKEALEKPLNPYPTQLYSGFSFMEKLDRDEALAALRKQQKNLEEEHEIVSYGLKVKKENLSSFALLVFEHMFETIKLQQKYINKAIKLL
ncbi:PadR family transcriptional regulator [Geomicrobium sp. JCM 19039]|uniref:PadR family transcriptional regulator n=1 Tax=Geomicrobium sp. JCM 19039 TaxID=1460636 RepID=UPI00045F22BE|nr:PadR family transcriptional regulator [Geomicrobium sp. JCM 19039]GAK11079.1 transcriptional regulator, PadR family [Geomicrobium sp. JCM 19039]